MPTKKKRKHNKTKKIKGQKAHVVGGAMWLAGASLQEISQSLNISLNTVRQWKNRYKWPDVTVETKDIIKTAIREEIKHQEPAPVPTKEKQQKTTRDEDQDFLDDFNKIVKLGKDIVKMGLKSAKQQCQYASILEASVLSVASQKGDDRERIEYLHEKAGLIERASNMTKNASAIYKNFMPAGSDEMEAQVLKTDGGELLRAVI